MWYLITSGKIIFHQPGSLENPGIKGGVFPNQTTMDLCLEYHFRLATSKLSSNCVQSAANHILTASAWGDRPRPNKFEAMLPPRSNSLCDEHHSPPWGASRLQNLGTSFIEHDENVHPTKPLFKESFSSVFLSPATLLSHWKWEKKPVWPIFRQKLGESQPSLLFCAPKKSAASSSAKSASQTCVATRSEHFHAKRSPYRRGHLK